MDNFEDTFENITVEEQTRDSLQSADSKYKHVSKHKPSLSIVDNFEDTIEEQNRDSLQSADSKFINESNRSTLSSLQSADTKYYGGKRSTVSSFHSVKSPGNMFDTLFHAPPESKLAHKLYRKKSVYLKYGQTLKNHNLYDPTDDKNSKWMIHPFSHFKYARSYIASYWFFLVSIFFLYRVFWDGIMIFLLLITLIVLPVGLAFYSDEQLQPQWVAINITVDFIFLLDILVIFRTGIAYNKSPERVSSFQATYKKE